MSDYPDAFRDACALADVYRAQAPGAKWVMLTVPPVVAADILMAYGARRIPMRHDDPAWDEDFEAWRLWSARLLLNVRRRGTWRRG